MPEFDPLKKQKFIDSNEWVLSAQTDFNLMADYEMFRASNITLKQKLPLRMFIGCKPRTHAQHGRLFNAIDYFDCIEKKYDQKPINAILENLEKLEACLMEQNPALRNIEINVLSEFSRGTGLGFVSAFCVLLAALIALYNKKAAFSDFRIFQEGPTIANLEQAHPVLYQIYLASNLYEAILRDKKTYGTNTYPKFIRSSQPILVRSGKKDIEGGKISDFFHSSFDLSQMVDYLILYTGRPSHSKTLSEWPQANLHPLQKIITEHISKNCYDNLEKLYREGYSEEAMKRFLHSITKFRYASHLMENTNISLERLKNELIHILHVDHPNIDFGLKYLNSSAIGGSLLAVLSKNLSREHLDKIIKKLSSLSREYPALIYVSWEEGVGEEGIEIIKTPNQFSADHPEETKIILDKLENKIYINGQKIHSDELPSQYQTIQILELLLKKPNQEIPNTAFKISSYSKNKYDMLSKIILPLGKLIQAKLGHNLKIECRGSQIKFYLRYQPSDLNIEIKE